MEPIKICIFYTTLLYCVPLLCIIKSVWKCWWFYSEVNPIVLSKTWTVILSCSRGHSGVCHRHCHLGCLVIVGSGCLQVIGPVCITWTNYLLGMDFSEISNSLAIQAVPKDQIFKTSLQNAENKVFTVWMTFEELERKAARIWPVLNNVPCFLKCFILPRTVYSNNQNSH